MRVLILTFYYPPDIGPGSVRANALAEALLRVGGSSIKVDVLTTMPNRYASLNARACESEDLGQLRVRRFPLPPHKSGMVDQARAFGVFARHALAAAREHHWDLIVATSARLMTQCIGAWVARRAGAPLYLDVRDLFTETIEEVLPSRPLKMTVPVFRALERWSLKSANKVNVLSPGFTSHIENSAPGVSWTAFTNGIDEEFLSYNVFSSNRVPSDTGLVPSRPLILYAGNVGDGQALHRIIPEVAERFQGRARFRVVGDGGRRREFADALKERRLNNLEFVDPVPRKELIQHYQEAAVLFLHLNDLKAFRKVLPSKIFEYAATGKPILAGVAGEAARFLKEHVEGAAVFEPCDASGMSEALDTLLAGPEAFDRDHFRRSFRRSVIMDEMAKVAIDLVIDASSVRLTREVTKG